MPNVRENLDGRNWLSTSSRSMQWPPNVKMMFEKPWKKASRPSGGCVAAWACSPCAQLDPIMYQLGSRGGLGEVRMAPMRGGRDGWHRLGLGRLADGTGVLDPVRCRGAPAAPGVRGPHERQEGEDPHVAERGHQHHAHRDGTKDKRELEWGGGARERVRWSACVHAVRDRVGWDEKLLDSRAGGRVCVRAPLPHRPDRTTRAGRTSRLLRPVPML